MDEPIESNDLSTEVIEDITDSSENTRESRLLENPTRKTISKSDGEISIISNIVLFIRLLRLGFEF